MCIRDRICICLAIVFFIVLIVSLPSIVTNNIFGLDGTQPVEGMTLDSSYTQMEQVVSNVIEAAYQTSLSRVEQIISSGGYNYEASSDATINYAQSSAGYDTCYILAAYSASLEQQGTDPDDMTAKLNSVATVSYTHLDVYQRQGVYWAFDQTRHTGRSED